MKLQRLAWLGFIGAILGFVLTPMVAVIYASFFSDRILSFPPSGYTFAWYVHAWNRPEFASSFVLSLKIATASSLLSLCVGVPASIAIERLIFPGRNALRELLLAPFYVPAIVLGAAVYIFYVQIEAWSGVRNAGTLWGLIGAHTLIALPWVMRLVSTSLAMTPRSGEEAASSLGATPWQAFVMVTLPSIRPGLVAGGLFAFIASFGELEKSLFLVGPGQQTLPVAIVSYLSYSLDSTIAAVASVQIAIVAIAMAVSSRYVKLGKVL